MRRWPSCTISATCSSPRNSSSRGRCCRRWSSRPAAASQPRAQKRQGPAERALEIGGGRGGEAASDLRLGCQTLKENLLRLIGDEREFASLLSGGGGGRGPPLARRKHRCDARGLQ